MKTMTFNEFTKDSTNVKESSRSGCMSESMVKKCNEMYEAMCAEMKSCHEDKTERTAENYMAECNEKLNEMMEGIKSACNECMK